MTVRRFFIALLLFLGTTFVSKAQFTSVRQLFEVDQIRGCTGLTVMIDISPSSATDCVRDPMSGVSDCNFDYEGDGTNDNPGQSDLFTFTYDDPGVYWLKILFPNNANASLEGFDSVRIEVFEKLPPTFDIWSCANEGIVVNITDTDYDFYRINYGDLSEEEVIAQGDPNPQHNYSGNAPRTLTIQGIDTDAAENCPVATKTINPLNTLPVTEITALTAIDEQTLVIDYTTFPDILQRLEIDPNGNNSFNFLQDIIPGTTSDTIRNLDLVNNYYCFIINTVDPCINAVAGSSNIVCSIQLSADFIDNANDLSWLTENPDQNFTILRDNMPLTNVGINTRSFSDTDIECNTMYSYQVIGNYNNTVTSTSLSVSGTSISTTPPDPITEISLQVQGSDILVDWQAPGNVAIAEYGLTRTSGGTSADLGTTGDLQFRDTDLMTDLESFCYQVRTLDECGNANMQSVVPCSILLQGTIDASNNVSLGWNDFTGWSAGVASYTVEKTYPNNTTVTQDVNTTFFEEQELNGQFQVIQYRIIANPVDQSLAPSISNVITLIKSTNLHQPTAFTPDGDDLNDTFGLKGNFIASYELKIFTKWGELIFSSDNMDRGWNGRLEGRDLPEGTYAFRSRIVDFAGRETERLGTVVLLRN